jgi:hypothetical protein
MTKKALIEADRELSRLLQLGLGPFAIAEAYSIPVRRLATDNQLSFDDNPPVIAGIPQRKPRPSHMGLFAFSVG